MKKREKILIKFREYFMMDIGLDQFMEYEEEEKKEDTILSEMIEEFRRR